MSHDGAMVCLRFVIVVFPDLTHLLFLYGYVSDEEAQIAMLA